MAFVIGLDDLSGMATQIWASSQSQPLLDNVISTHVAVTGQEVTRAEVYGSRRSGVTGLVDVGLINVTDGNALIAQATVNLDADAAAWYGTDFSSPVSLVAGKTYATCFSIRNTTNIYEKFGNSVNSRSALDGTSALADPFVIAAVESKWWAVTILGDDELTLTAPDSTTVDATRTVIGTALGTTEPPQTAGLKISDDSYSVTLDITEISSTSYSQVDSIDSGIALGTPVNSLPVEVDPADMAAGATAYQIKQWVNDGTNPEVSRDITLNYLAAHTSKQAMIAGADAANTTPGESLLATTIIAVEDDMQFTGPDVVDTVTITYAADGTLTTDKDQTITFNVRYWSPSTGQASLASITVKGSAILGGTGGEGATNLHYVNRTQFYIN